MARHDTESQPLYKDDTDTESEFSEPERPPKKGKGKGLKKRLSEVHHDKQRVAVNDDAAEKRRRRKTHTTRLHVVNHEENQEAEGSRVARQRALQAAAASQPDSQNINVNIDNYEQWMKLATDNKINAANSWGVALIDYFHDMSLLRNDDDNSINFQRASCTLDGCVKIWTSRVDSVTTETGKLLTNLATQRQGQDTHSDEEEENVDPDDPDADPTRAKEKKKNKRSKNSTLSNPEQLLIKKLELEFSVDPLFKKTCADFDDSGAQGLLMNHLSLGLGSDGSMRVVFDASDTMVDIQEEDGVVEEPEELIDFTEMQKHLHMEDLEDRVICPSFQDFSFARDVTSLPDQPAAFYADDLSDNEDFGPSSGLDPNTMDVEVEGAPESKEEDFFTGDDAINQDYGYNGGAWDGNEGENPPDESEGDSHSGSVHASGVEGPHGSYTNFDPRQGPGPRDLVMAMNEGTKDPGGMMDYFDQNMLKNWAGPEHWKTRRVLRKANESKSTARRKTKEKEVIKIDFSEPLHPSLHELKNETFRPPDKLSSLNLPKHKKDDADDNLLPDDMHFDPRELVRLFLKPKFTMQMRKHGVSLSDGTEGPFDEAYWAKGAAEAAKTDDDNDPALTQGGGVLPFSTQFLHDDDDDNNAFDLGFDAPAGELDDPSSGADNAAVAINLEEQDLLAATEQDARNRRAKPEFVKYSKKAKRVDVRKLKDNIWKGLGIVIDDSGLKKTGSRDVDGDEDMEEEDHISQSPKDPTQSEPTDPTDGKDFSNVLAGLSSRYPEEKMDEISTSFCFICLLHLANERGLKLDRGVNEEDDMNSKMDTGASLNEQDDKMIGNIWDLKIYRDPEAFSEL